MEEKKPDSVVYNKSLKKYDASLKPYPTDLGSPVIKTNDTITWKNTNIQKANHKFSTIYQELKDKYDALIDRFKYNELIYASKFNFEPIVGKTYYLYLSKNNRYFLSILSPKECSFNFSGSFKLNSDKIWEKIQI